MIKRNIYLSLILSLLFITFQGQSSYAIELDETTRTVTLEESGKTIILTPEQVKRGKRLFNNSCASCHNGGITKTNPNIGLELESLSLATPARNNIQSLISYMKDPTSYDGTTSIAELHPSIKSAEIFPKMRNLTDEDLFAIAGHILMQPKIAAEKWGGGKIYY
uniref:Photosystem II cytochrome c550 n=1 Tax=Gelidium elegans TaxID=37200 RepID=A0A141SDL1_GELEL|nr:photosystem II cytochrome c550 [Gelidium elegans]AMK96379.1 photosystem II cytochrome c550 [Gelidium elegans]